MKLKRLQFATKVSLIICAGAAVFLAVIYGLVLAFVYLHMLLGGDDTASTIITCIAIFLTVLVCVYVFMAVEGIPAKKEKK